MPDMDHAPIELNDWKGLFARGGADNVPPGYFIDSLNVRFDGTDAISREGSSLEITQTDIIRFFSYKKLTSTRMLLGIGGGVGNIYDSTALGFGIINTAAGEPNIVDFSMINFNNRAYITNHNRVTGIASSALYVYDDINIGALARRAAGPAPTGYVVAAVESATAGNCEAGVHLVSIVNITNSGFITEPGPNVVAVTSTGGFKIDVSNIDAGPAGTIARGVVATKAIQNYNGDPNSYEFFQVPSANGGLVSNNNNNETAALSFFDSELTVSVDYLFDNRDVIPSGTGLCEYKGRLVIWGFLGDEHSVYLSRSGAPEEFDSVGGIISVDPFESHSGVNNCFVFRGSLIICKRNRVYQTTDNGGDPSTWQVDMIDNGAGTECFGVSVIIDSKGQENDRVFIADISGLLMFEGYVRRPEATWLVEDIWKRINKAKFNLIQVCNDPTTSSVFVSLPLDANTNISHILYGYYGEAFEGGDFNPKAIKWDIWQFQAGQLSILIDLDSTTGQTVFKYCGTASNIYNWKVDSGVLSDNSQTFAAYIKVGKLFAKSGWINHFSGLKFRITGSGTLSMELSGLDDTNAVAPPTLTLSAAPGVELFRLINYKNEKMSVKFAVGAPDYFSINKLTAFAKALWFGRPA